MRPKIKRNRILHAEHAAILKWSENKFVPSSVSQRSFQFQALFILKLNEATCFVLFCFSIKGSCRRHLKFFPPADGRRLESHLFLNLSIGKYTPCEHRCIMENRCVSVNIGPLTEKNEVTCELNDADYLQYPGDLKYHPGWTYRGTEVRHASNVVG